MIAGGRRTGRDGRGVVRGGGEEGGGRKEVWGG
jgi:hypothetical protein